MHPGVGENVAALRRVRLAAQRLGRLDKIINAAVAVICRDVRAVDLVNAMRNPVHDERLRTGVPKRTVDLVGLGVNDVEPVARRRSHHFDFERGRRSQLAFARRQFQNVIARLGKCRRGDVRVRVGKSHLARAGILAPSHFGRRIRLQKFHRAGQIGFAVHHHIAVHAGVDARRKIRRFAGIQNPPLQNAGGKIFACRPSPVSVSRS